MFPEVRKRPAASPPRKLFPAPENENHNFRQYDQMLTQVPVTSTIFPASSLAQNASTHVPSVVRVFTKAPIPPLRIITQPLPLAPIPRSRNLTAACSIKLLVGGSGSDKSARASSALGLSIATAVHIRHNLQIVTQSIAHLKIDMKGKTLVNDGNSSGIHLSFIRRSTVFHDIVETTHRYGLIDGCWRPTTNFVHFGHNGRSTGRGADEV